MYSLILMTAMTSAPQGPEFNGYFRDLFSGRSCNGCCGGSCNGQSYTNYGCSDRPPLGSRIRAFFSFGGCCGGCCGGCYGGCCGSRTANSCYGSCLGSSCYGSSCSGGSLGGYESYPPPPGVGVFGGVPGPTYDSQPYAVPGAIPPTRLPGADGVPYAPNSPAPPTSIDTSRSYPQPQGGIRATVVVRLPADARLYAEGRLLQLASAERTFVTPPLPVGRECSYTFKVEYERSGETVTQTRKVTVQPGKATALEFVDLIAKAAPPVPSDLATKPATVNPVSTKPVEPAPAKEVERPGNPFRGPSFFPTSGGERAKLTVKLPAGATLYIDDKKKDGSDGLREFTTPPLPVGKEFAYLVTVEVVRNGLPERVTEKVTFRAGETVTRDFAVLLPSGR